MSGKEQHASKKEYTTLWNIGKKNAGILTADILKNSNPTPQEIGAMIKKAEHRYRTIVSSTHSSREKYLKEYNAPSEALMPFLKNALFNYCANGDYNQMTDMFVLYKEPISAGNFNIEMRNNNGFTPLMVAIINNNNTCAELLIECGANIYVDDLFLFFYARNVDNWHIFNKLLVANGNSKRLPIHDILLLADTHL